MGGKGDRSREKSRLNFPTSKTILREEENIN